MSNPYVGEIRMFAGTFAPLGWNFCDGSLQSIANYFPLFTVIGTTYGGDGQETFALPDLRGRVPIHQGSGFTIGQMAGVETVTLNTNQIPLHTHGPIAHATESGNVTSPANNFWSASSLNQFSSAAGAPSTALHSGAVSIAGGSQPHDNMMPVQAINFIIAMDGVFPSPN
jgi:microcystin-dependent protein